MKLKALLFIGILSCLSCITTEAKNIRIKQNINRDWKFVLKDLKGAEATSFNDNDWDHIHLPHSFSIPYFMWHSVYQGHGWYRKDIEILDAWKNENISLEFEGAFIEKEIFINGVYIGKHVGGYTGFNFDITPYIKTGKNIIAVRVNNLWNPRVAPRAGDHQFSGGIYRDVYLNITDKLYVDYYGTFVSTPQVSKESAICEITTEIRNKYNKDKKCTVRTEIKDQDGKVSATIQSTETIKKGCSNIFKQTLPTITNPKLWSPESPYLYTAVTTVYSDGNITDSYETPFGIRSFKWTADKGFFLNGEHYYLLGANVHQDQAGWGDAVTNAAMYRDVQMMKDAGFNCIRGSHYPHDPAFSQACDEIGMILFQENAFWGMGGSSGDRGWGGNGPSSSCYPPNPQDQSDFDKSVLTQLKEMIKTHRNHASIAAWSMSNEPFFTDNSTDNQMKKLLNMATDSSRIWDPTREVAIGGAQRKEVDRLGKNAIAFYNGDGATLYPNPGFPNMVSEYGSTVAQRPGKFIPGWSSLDNGNTDGFYHPEWRSGQIIWCGYDHGTIGGEALATMGLVDYFRIPKRQYFWYQRAYIEGQRPPVEPEWPKDGIPAILKLEASNTIIGSTNGTDDTQLIITINDINGKHISNNVPVELSIISGPGEFPTGTKIQFMPPSKSEASDITIRDGKAAIAFRSYYAGKTIIKATSSGLKSDTIEIVTQGEPLWIENVTPKVKDRPYNRYINTNHYDKKSTAVNSSEMLLAKNRPSWVSSTLSGTSKAYVNDENSSTIWKPSKDDKEKWWELALEASYCVNQIQIEFPVEDYYNYWIEVSSDEINWTKVVEDSCKTKLRTYKNNFGCDIAFIRIVFRSEIAGLAEVRVGGIPSALQQ